MSAARSLGCLCSDVHTRKAQKASWRDLHMGNNRWHTTPQPLQAPSRGTFLRIHNLGNREKRVLNAGPTYQGWLARKNPCRTHPLPLVPNPEPSHLEECSPLVHVLQVKTPHLVIHCVRSVLFCLVYRSHSGSGRLGRKSVLSFSNSPGSDSCGINQDVCVKFPPRRKIQCVK